MLTDYDTFAGLMSTYWVCKISWLSLDFLDFFPWDDDG
jgi:hypothetical protein